LGVLAVELIFIFSIFLGFYYVYLCFEFLINPEKEKIIAKKIFIYSILYLFLIFSIILIDKVL
jgi:Polyprenyltransferase (cytochrome oxidase assembly factor)